MPLEPRLCQVGGVNQNYLSKAGTLYHIQIEDRGPVIDRVKEVHVRRVNTIVYANYGEPNARIVYGRDSDFDDVRTQDHNRFMERQVQELSAEARRIIEEKEQRQVARIKAVVREYYHTKDEAAKKEFEEANALYPFLFSKAWAEMRQEKAGASPAPPPVDEPSQLEEVLYPLDAELREKVLDIERIIAELSSDVQRLKDEGSADDILLQTCRKLMARAQESLVASAEFNSRRLDMNRDSLMTTWRQVRSRLKRA